MSKILMDMLNAERDTKLRYLSRVEELEGVIETVGQWLENSGQLQSDRVAMTMMRLLNDARKGNE